MSTLTLRYKNDTNSYYYNKKKISGAEVEKLFFKQAQVNKIEKAKREQLEELNKSLTLDLETANTFLDLREAQIRKLMERICDLKGIKSTSIIGLDRKKG